VDIPDLLPDHQWVADVERGERDKWVAYIIVLMVLKV
jgi:hypothetical protein